MVIDGIPVQFLPAYNPLLEEALEHARMVDVEGMPTRVLRIEYLIGVSVQTGRSKDRERVQLLMEAGNVDAEAPGGDSYSSPSHVADIGRRMVVNAPHAACKRLLQRNSGAGRNLRRCRMKRNCAFYCACNKWAISSSKPAGHRLVPGRWTRKRSCPFLPYHRLTLAG